MNLRDLCFHLRKRRRMYLPNDRFSTAVAFVEGYNTAFDGVPLLGFNDYVARRILKRESSLHWSCVIASTQLPAILDGGIGIDQVPVEFDIYLTEKLIDLLEGYQDEASSAGSSS